MQDSQVALKMVVMYTRRSHEALAVEFVQEKATSLLAPFRSYMEPCYLVQWTVDVIDVEIHIR